MSLVKETQQLRLDRLPQSLRLRLECHFPVLDSSIYFWTRHCSWGSFCLRVDPSWTWKSQPLFLFLDSSGSKSQVPQDSLAQGAVAFSASTGRILLKINIYKHIPYKCREFGCDRSKIKGILQEEQCTFSAVSRLLLQRFVKPHTQLTFVTNDVGLVSKGR